MIYVGLNLILYLLIHRHDVDAVWYSQMIGNQFGLCFIIIFFSQNIVALCGANVLPPILRNQPF